MVANPVHQIVRATRSWLKSGQCMANIYCGKLTTKAKGPRHPQLQRLRRTARSQQRRQKKSRTRTWIRTWRKTRIQTWRNFQGEVNQRPSPARQSSQKTWKTTNWTPGFCGPPEKQVSSRCRLDQQQAWRWTRWWPSRRCW